MNIRSLIAATALGAIGLTACGSGSTYGGPAAAPGTAATNVPATTVASRDSSLGSVLVDGNQLTLYGLTKDSDGTPTCVDACAVAWPPLTITGTTVPAGLDASVFSVVSRPDGTHQLKAGKWPLYRYVGDAAPGDVNGQGSGGVWFVVTPTGGLHKT